MYTCHLVKTNGTLTNCERLSKAEYIDFISNIYGKWPTIRVENELTGEVRVFTDNGQAWERILTTSEREKPLATKDRLGD